MDQVQCRLTTHLLVRAASFGVLTAVVVGLLASTSQAASAKIDVLVDDPTTLVLNFTDTNGQSMPLTFSRDDEQSLWREADTQSAVPGITFGNTDPQFAPPARQRASGITPQQAITTFDKSIAARPMDDITIYELGAGDMAIALWQGGVITEIWYVGSLVEAIINPVWVGWSFCERAQELCCETVPGPGGFQTPDEVPKPHIQACKAVAQNCGEAAKQQACNCLNTACEFCDEEDGYPDLCCGDDEGEEDCDYPWMPKSSEDACVAGVEVCVDPPVPPEPDAVDNLLVEIANRLQVLVDIQNG